MTILIPVYNVEPFLKDCIDSIARQKLDGVEVIALDDGSTDGSLGRLHEQRDHALPQLKIERHTHNQGLSATRNHLIAAATGEYLWFVDSDDMLVAGAIHALRRIIEQSRPDIIGCDYFRRYLRRRVRDMVIGPPHKRTFQGPHRRLLTDHEAVIQGTFRAQKLYIWSRVFRRELACGEALFPIGRRFEDAHALPRLLLRARTYFHEPSPFVVYRERPQSISRSNDVRSSADLAYSLTGMHGEFAPAIRKMSPTTQLAVAAYCASTYVQARRLIAGRNRSSAHAIHEQLLASLRRASPLSVRQLMQHCMPRPTRWRIATKFAFWYYLPDIAGRLRL